MTCVLCQRHFTILWELSQHHENCIKQRSPPEVDRAVNQIKVLKIEATQTFNAASKKRRRDSTDDRTEDRSHRTSINGNFGKGRTPSCGPSNSNLCIAFAMAESVFATPSAPQSLLEPTNISQSQSQSPTDRAPFLSCYNMDESLFGNIDDAVTALDAEIINKNLEPLPFIQDARTRRRTCIQ